MTTGWCARDACIKCARRRHGIAGAFGVWLAPLGGLLLAWGFYSVLGWALTNVS